MNQAAGAPTSGPWFTKGPGRDPEVVARVALEPPTEREQRGRDLLTPVDLEIFRHKMDSVVDEGRSVLKALSMAETMQIGDDVVSLFTACGDLAATATGVYFHAMLNYGPIKYICKHYADDPTVGVREGDIFFFNETLSGLVHPYDMFIAMPIFHAGELIAWVSAGGHQGEAGSKDPGGFVPTALSRYEEGIHVPPLKIGEGFVIHTDHLHLLANAVRNPVQLSLDLKTRVAVCMRVRQRLLREVERRGADYVVGGLRELLRSTGDLARQRLLGLNDGTYRAVVFLDTIGTEDALLRVPVTLRKRVDHLDIDFTGASPEHRRGPSHMFWHVVRSVTAVYLFSHVYRGLPLNAGLYEPVEVIVPAGTFLNASEDVAHGQDSFTGRVCVQALHLAGSRLIFDSEQREATAAPFAANFVEYLFGGRDRHGMPVAGVPSSINAQGQGARFDRDGEHTCGFFWAPEVDCLSAEENEARYPWVYLSRNLIDADLHGYGRQRGGVGMTDIFVLDGVFSIDCASIGHGHLFSLDPGLFAGYAGPPAARVVVRNSDLKRRMARRDADLPYGLRPLCEGQPLAGEYQFCRIPTSANPHGDQDVFVMHAGSGGGYGDVLERDPDQVALDVRRGLITAEVAQGVYHVALDPAAGTADQPATAAARERERRERLRRGVPYDEFMRGWLGRRPPDEALRFYGPWPGEWPV